MCSDHSSSADEVNFYSSIVFLEKLLILGFSNALSMINEKFWFHFFFLLFIWIVCCNQMKYISGGETPPCLLLKPIAK